MYEHPHTKLGSNTQNTHTLQYITHTAHTHTHTHKHNTIFTCPHTPTYIRTCVCPEYVDCVCVYLSSAEYHWTLHRHTSPAFSAFM